MIQGIKDKSIKGIYGQLNALIDTAADLGKREEVNADVMEKKILKGVLTLGLELLKLSINTRNTEVEEKGKPVVSGAIVNKGLTPRWYQSIFGELQINRRKYQIAGKGTYYPLDTSLNLPKEKYSYVLQNWIGKSSTDLDYRESVSMLNEILGLELNGVQSKSNANKLGEQVASYYASQAVKGVEPGQFLCVEWDGKGVPIIKEEQQGAEKEDSRTSVIVRLKKGEKRGVKKMATVSVVSDFTPKIRGKQSIIRGLFKSPLTILEAEKEEATLKLAHSQVTTNNWHQNIHRRAFMANQGKSINYGIELAQKRSQGKELPIIALVDGGVGLEGDILAAFEKKGMSDLLKYIILDIVHVSEYVWKAGNAILGENSNLRTPWVKEVLADLLDGKVSNVIDDLIANRDKTNLSKSKKQQLNKTITYFTNHQHKMDYKTYLAKGLPVSTALVESSCGHLVKDRMERSGMRWSMDGAQNMIDARAVKKNGDWSDFMAFVTQKNQESYHEKAA
ncbi:MAG: ISKra4 family transposase [Saprospiraceae bacterium]